MNYKILQLKELKNYAFMSFDFAKRNNFTLDDYEEVFDGYIQYNYGESTLDKLFTLFNRATSEDAKRLEQWGFKGRSLSVSDIIEIDNVYWYCDRDGWTKVAL